MKITSSKISLLPLLACAFYLSACNTEAHNGHTTSIQNSSLETKMTVPATKITGVWMQEDSDSNMLNPLSGYEFKKDGTLVPMNINTLESGTWCIKNNMLILQLKSVEDKITDTVRYKISLRKDELTLIALNSTENTKETYLRIR